MKLKIYNPDMTFNIIEDITIKTVQRYGEKVIEAHWRDKETNAPCSTDVTRISKGFYEEIVPEGWNNKD